MLHFFEQNRVKKQSSLAVFSISAYAMLMLFFRHPSFYGMSFMIAAMLFFSLMNNCIRHTSALMSPTDLVMWRNAITIPIMALWLWVFHSPAQFKTKSFKRHALRAVLGIISIELWFFSLSEMPINEATALSFTAPIFTSLFAIFWLKESSNPSRWLSILIGFIGTIIILDPSTDDLNPIAFAVLASAAIMALSSIVVKTLTRTDHTDTIVFYQGLVMLPLSLPFAIFNGISMPTLEGLFWALCVTVSSLAAHLCLTRAFATTEMVVLAPFDFIRLIFTAAIAYYWFGETLAGDTVLGGLLIVTASVLAAAGSSPDVKRRIKRMLMLYRE